MKILKIIEAWVISFSPTDEETEKAIARAEICESCEFKVELNSALLSKLTEHDKLLNKFKCGYCSCPLSKKLFSRLKNACPLNKWDI